MASIALAVLVSYFLIGDDKIEETITSAGFLIGDLLLIRKKKMGWTVNLIADILFTYILWEECNYLFDYLFIGFQLVSIYIGIKEAFSFKKSKLAIILFRNFGYVFASFQRLPMYIAMKKDFLFTKIKRAQKKNSEPFYLPMYSNRGPLYPSRSTFSINIATGRIQVCS